MIPELQKSLTYIKSTVQEISKDLSRVAKKTAIEDSENFQKIKNIEDKITASHNQLNDAINAMQEVVKLPICTECDSMIGVNECEVCGVIMCNSCTKKFNGDNMCQSCGDEAYEMELEPGLNPWYDDHVDCDTTAQPHRGPK